MVIRTFERQMVQHQIYVIAMENTFVSRYIIMYIIEWKLYERDYHLPNEDSVRVFHGFWQMGLA